MPMENLSKYFLCRINRRDGGCGWKALVTVPDLFLVSVHLGTLPAVRPGTLAIFGDDSIPEWQ